MAVSNVYLMDCMEFMAGCKDAAFDVAVVDPPYGLNMGDYQRTNIDGAGNRYRAEIYHRGDWDKAIPGVEYFNELRRVSRFQIIWGGNYYFDILGNSRGLICWYKRQPVPNFSDCEFAWTNFDRPSKVFDYKYFGNIEGNGKADERIHPTQKPVQLYKWLYQNYLKPGETVLDTHLGSGSSRIAAHHSNVDFHGVEISPEYFAAMEKRYKQETAQLSFF